MAVTKLVLTTCAFRAFPQPRCFWGRGRPATSFSFTDDRVPPRARTLLKPSRTDVTEDVVGSIIASQVTSS